MTAVSPTSGNHRAFPLTSSRHDGSGINVEDDLEVRSFSESGVSRGTLQAFAGSGVQHSPSDQTHQAEVEDLLDISITTEQSFEQACRMHPLFGFADRRLEVALIASNGGWRWMDTSVLCVVMALFHLHGLLTAWLAGEGGEPKILVSALGIVLMLCYGAWNYFTTVRGIDPTIMNPAQQGRFLFKAETIQAMLLTLGSIYAFANLDAEDVCRRNPEQDGVFSNPETARHYCNAIGFADAVRVFSAQIVLLRVRILQAYWQMIPFLLFLIAWNLQVEAERPALFVAAVQRGVMALTYLLFLIMVLTVGAVDDVHRRRRLVENLLRKRMTVNTHQRQQQLKKVLQAVVTDDCLLKLAEGLQVTHQAKKCVVGVTRLLDFGRWCALIPPPTAVRIVDFLQSQWDAVLEKYQSVKLQQTDDLYIFGRGLRLSGAEPDVPRTQSSNPGKASRTQEAEPSSPYPLNPRADSDALFADIVVRFAMFQLRTVERMPTSTRQALTKCSNDTANAVAKMRCCVGLDRGIATGSFVGTQSLIYAVNGPALDGALALSHFGETNRRVNSVYASDAVLEGIRDRFVVAEVPMDQPPTAGNLQASGSKSSLLGSSTGTNYTSGAHRKSASNLRNRKQLSFVGGASSGGGNGSPRGPDDGTTTSRPEGKMSPAEAGVTRVKSTLLSPNRREGSSDDLSLDHFSVVPPLITSPPPQPLPQAPASPLPAVNSDFFCPLGGSPLELNPSWSREKDMNEFLSKAERLSVADHRPSKCYQVKGRASALPLTARPQSGTARESGGGLSASLMSLLPTTSQAPPPELSIPSLTVEEANLVDQPPEIEVEIQKATNEVEQDTLQLRRDFLLRQANLYLIKESDPSSKDNRDILAEGGASKLASRLAKDATAMQGGSLGSSSNRLVDDTVLDEIFDPDSTKYSRLLAEQAVRFSSLRAELNLSFPDEKLERLYWSRKHRTGASESLESGVFFLNAVLVLLDILLEDAWDVVAFGLVGCVSVVNTLTLIHRLQQNGRKPTLESEGAARCSLGSWSAGWVQSIATGLFRTIMSAVLIVGANLAKPMFLNGNAVPVFAFVCIANVLCGQSLPWYWISLRLTVLAAVNLAVYPAPEAAAADLVFTTLLYSYAGWNREQWSRRVFLEHVMLLWAKVSSQMQLYLHRGLLFMLMPHFLVEKMMRKRIDGGCISMQIEECVILDVRFSGLDAEVTRRRSSARGSISSSSSRSSSSNSMGGRSRMSMSGSRSSSVCLENLTGTAPSNQQPSREEALPIQDHPLPGALSPQLMSATIAHSTLSPSLKPPLSGGSGSPNAVGRPPKGRDPKNARQADSWFHSRILAVEEILASLTERFGPSGCLLSVVHIVGDSLRVAGPMTRPPPESDDDTADIFNMNQASHAVTAPSRNKKGDALASLFQLTRRQAQLNKSKQAAVQSLALLEILMRRFSNVTAALVVDTGFAAVLGASPPTFQVVGAVSRVATELLKAAPEGTTVATERLMRLAFLDDLAIQRKGSIPKLPKKLAGVGVEEVLSSSNSPSCEFHLHFRAEELHVEQIPVHQPKFEDSSGAGVVTLDTAKFGGPAPSSGDLRGRPFTARNPLLPVSESESGLNEAPPGQEGNQTKESSSAGSGSTEAGLMKTSNPVQLSSADAADGGPLARTVDDATSGMATLFEEEPDLIVLPATTWSVRALGCPRIHTVKLGMYI